MRPLVVASTIAFLATAGLARLARASETLPNDLVTQLDRLPAAKERRLIIIDETVRQQQEQRRGPQAGRGGERGGLR